MRMVEKVARAIDPLAFDDWQKHFDYEMRASGNEAEAKAFADWTSGKRIADAKEKARSALEAMREPTEAMVRAASEECVSFDHHGNDGDMDAQEAIDAYRVMIDKALESAE